MNVVYFQVSLFYLCMRRITLHSFNYRKKHKMFMHTGPQEAHRRKDVKQNTGAGEDLKAAGEEGLITWRSPAKTDT